jgi:hypothetical protein
LCGHHYSKYNDKGNIVKYVTYFLEGYL